MNQERSAPIPAPDLTRDFPRSPRATIGGFVIAARTLDKCRAVVAGTQGEYHFDCPLDRQFLDFSGTDAEAMKRFVATGADDEAMDRWIREKSTVSDKEEIIAWNNKMRAMRPCDLEMKLQVFLEEYIPGNLPPEKPVYVWFDVYDIEEKRL